ncbi:cytochrome P450 [Cryphonectria parasitica EP155]|uniref:Cytochrome P450 n=1 Tax=Cryphonectria parasitica (strain ATCC 38755 / EP155) TaxID=660469 RepID=A0A9P5CU04_CRYP1|nr:cytochrome P450 [Cryphonectria parasitica EP155]KAF3771184.1 cytochrome P450 [Cryphonectria parasitica EP155]
MANLTGLSSQTGFPLDLAVQKWQASISVVLISLFALFLKITWQPAFPKSAPKLVREWPILGALALYGRRKAFFDKAVSKSPSGNFSTYMGKFQVVGVSGPEARQSFFDSKDLSMNEGYSTLFTASPDVGGVRDQKELAESHGAWMVRNMTKVVSRETLLKCLPFLVSDATSAYERLLLQQQDNDDDDKSAKGKKSIIDPAVVNYDLVYQLTMRTVGAVEIANDPALSAKTLKLFEEVERNASTMRIIFPWLPTLGWLRQMYAGARLYGIFDSIAKARKAEGRREEDTMQVFLDADTDMVKLTTFIVGSLFAGQVNTGVNAGWIIIYLATNREWYQRVQAEVDASLQRHRTSPSQTPQEILATLSLEDWETEFPLIDLSLRESIRLSTVGVMFRRNIGAGDLPISKKSGEVVPRGAFAIYAVDDVHMNPDVYSAPEKFDPGRYLPGRAEDKKTTHAYLGWGAGRHPCIGMRFAKLEVAIVTAFFFALFDFELVDAEGNVLDEPPPVDRQAFSVPRPVDVTRLRYTARQKMSN